MFAIPRGNSTYFGTTDTNYQDNKNDVRTSLVDALYLISAVNKMFNDVSISIDDVKSSWAGLRPLIHEEGKPASELSRKDEIYVSNTELISIAGGKLTGYRKMAERIVDLINKKYLRRFDKVFHEVKTEKIVLSGGSFTNHKEVLNYIKTIQEKISKLGLNKKDAAYFVYNYGKQTDVILTKFDELTDVDIEQRMIKAEVWFSILYESACSPVDFFMRRTGRAYFNIDSVYKHLNLVLTEFSTHFSWNNEILNKKKEELNKELKSITSFT
jgi:glycerol-3-phosphate dehydrogenase